MKTTPKKTTTTKMAAVDPRGLALLSVIDNGNAERAAAAAVVARAILARFRDMDGDMMHGTRDANGGFGAVVSEVLARYQKSEEADSKSEYQMLHAIRSYGEIDLPSTDSEVAFDVLVACVCEAAMVGAALMYELANGAAR